MTLNKEQRDKVKSLKKTLDIIAKEVEKHVALDEPKILKMNNYELLIGTVQLLYENELIKNMKVIAMEPKNEMTFDHNNLTEKKTFH